MIIDLVATTGFNDQSGMRNFFLVHQFVHDQTAAALTAKYSVPQSSFGVTDQAAENAWLKLMADKKPGQPSPPALQTWLQVHNAIHLATALLLGQTASGTPDLSEVDFGSEQEFYDWMFDHQQIHDYEQQSLGLS